MTYCIWCGLPSHPIAKPCEERVGLTGQEMADAEKRYLRGLRRTDGTGVLAPLDDESTSDLWQDGW